MNSDSNEAISHYDTVGILHALDDLLVYTLTYKKSSTSSSAQPSNSNSIAAILPLQANYKFIDLRIALSAVAVSLAVWAYFKGRAAPFWLFVASVIAYFIIDGIIELMNMVLYKNVILKTRAVRGLPDPTFTTRMEKFSPFYTIEVFWATGSEKVSINTTKVIDKEGNVLKKAFSIEVIKLLKEIEKNASSKTK